MKKRIIFLMMATVIALNFMPLQVLAAEPHTLCVQNYGAGIDEAGLFATDYVVTVDKVSARTGPGEGYSVTCTLYKGYIVAVKSISNGWAKFKLKGEWTYVPASALEKE